LRAIAAVGAMMPMESAIASKKESSRRSLPSCFSTGHLHLRIVQKERLLSYKCLQSETITVVSLRMMCNLPLFLREYLANRLCKQVYGIVRNVVKEIRKAEDDDGCVLTVLGWSRAWHP